MSQQPRRDYGAARDFRGFHVKIAPESHAKLHRMAAALGVSLGALVDLMAEHAEVDENDRPTWAADMRQELPLAG